MTPDESSSTYTGRVDPRTIPTLLPFGLLYHSLMPWNTVFVLDGLIPPRRGIPPWTMRLELAYHQFDPAIWDILKADDDADLAEGVKLLKEREAMKALSKRDSAEELAMEKKVTACWTRITTRWMQIYALHTCRKQYFEQQKQLHPGWTDQDVLANLPLGDDFAPPPAATRSLWPLPIPHPDPARRPHIINLCAPGFDWSPFCLWDESTTESDLAEQRMSAIARKQQEKLANAGGADTQGGGANDRLFAVRDTGVPLDKSSAHLTKRSKDKSHEE